MIKILSRLSSTAKSKVFDVNYAIDDFSDFPIKYHKNIPNLEDVKVKDYLYRPSDVEGIKLAHDSFMTLLVEGKYAELEDMTEHNFFIKLKEICEKYKKLGYTFQKIGNSDDAAVKIIGVSYFSGGVTPYRNLNLSEKSYYQQPLIDPVSKAPVGVFFRTRNPKSPPKDFSKFNDLDLKALNASDPSQYQDKLEELATLFQWYPLRIKAIDAGIVSSCKLVVLDKKGKPVYGEFDEELKVFRLFRMETIIEMKGWLTAFWNWKTGIKTFIDEQFKGMVGQYYIVDVDGFADGNPYTY
ncbi:unnamed protein product [Blepharisma stoltei]|uniref:Uncharacterized protein n=1 Tax=Blepharisma stoltei TaxID=1481888 RepID=A0AAU9ITJ8_9CILI|nr:unnamed protein product [Blepharisma stoltei]